MIWPKFRQNNQFRQKIYPVFWFRLKFWLNNRFGIANAETKYKFSVFGWTETEIQDKFSAKIGYFVEILAKSWLVTWILPNLGGFILYFCLCAMGLCLQWLLVTIKLKCNGHNQSMINIHCFRVLFHLFPFCAATSTPINRH